MKQSLFPIFLLLASNLYATTFQIGSTKEYLSPNALYLADVVEDGDTIEIDAETYTGTASLAVWFGNDLLIKGIGGRPHLVADGEYIWQKGIWVFAGNNITVENIEFSGAIVPDKNGAGIRLDGVGMTVRNCFFHDNEDGILTSNPYDGDILIEYSEFANNGYGNGYSHNLYVGHVNKLTFQFNYTHHAKVGQCLKSRAQINIVLYNRIMDEETGYSSRLIDLPNGGFALIMGNNLMQGQNAENGNLIGFGAEGLANNPPHELYVINNSLVNKREASCNFVFIKDGTNTAVVSNNIFAGSGTSIVGTTSEMSNNLIEVEIEDVFFVDEPNYDYHLTNDSPAVDNGIDILPIENYSLTPEYEYIHPTNYEERTTSNGDIDIGAYEYQNTTAINKLTLKNINIYPNPSRDYLKIDSESNKITQIAIYNIYGRLVLSKRNVNVVDLHGLHAGIYYLYLDIDDGESLTRKFIIN